MTCKGILKWDQVLIVLDADEQKSQQKMNGPTKDLAPSLKSIPMASLKSIVAM
ncbi:MAG: hypothetical protein ACK53Y_02615 [bacterium]|jgi:hypothetical protein